MAHTDKTEPLKVRLWHHALVRVEEHDHRNRGCDLPTTLEDFLARPWGAPGCRWELQWTGIGVCACGMCTGAHWRRMDRRAERQRVRRGLGEQVMQWNGTGDVDDD